MICGGTLEYAEQSKEMTCAKCGKKELANVYCSDGHYVCDHCHGQGAFEFIKSFVQATDLKDPLEIAEILLNHDEIIPMLGCEHALIASASLMAALKNLNSLNITNDDIEEAMQRTKRQAIGAYCGLTGVCGIAPAIGACFSVVLGAACPKDKETATTMRVVSRIIEIIANETGPCCCKNFLRNSLMEAVSLAEKYLNVKLPSYDVKVSCRDDQRHPHGCRKQLCRFFVE